MDAKAKEAAEKAAKEKAEKAELEAKEAAEKAAKEKEAKEKKFKKEYEVAVTGFYAFGKMFRGRDKINSNQYKDYIEKWLKEGKIR